MKKIKGLGDVIAAITKKFGINPCAGCKKRQEFLNKLVTFPFMLKDKGDVRALRGTKLTFITSAPHIIT